MSNTITIELCPKDRARLDRLAEAMERKTCDRCVDSALHWLEQGIKTNGVFNEKEKESDPLQQKLAETLAKAKEPVEATKNAPEQAETSTPSTTPPEEETPKNEEPTTPPTAEPVGRAELRAKVIELSAKGLKEQVKEIVREYAQTVTNIPEDRVSECYMRLAGLEG